MTLIDVLSNNVVEAARVYNNTMNIERYYSAEQMLTAAYSYINLINS